MVRTHIQCVNLWFGTLACACIVPSSYRTFKNVCIHRTLQSQEVPYYTESYACTNILHLCKILHQQSCTTKLSGKLQLIETAHDSLLRLALHALANIPGSQVRAASSKIDFRNQVRSVLGI